MRRETRAERDAWTEFIDGEISSPKANKYGAVRTEFNGKKYASRREAFAAANYQALQAAGIIKNLREQHPIVLVQGDGKIRPVVWIADFTYFDTETNEFHAIDVKGFKTPVYRLKKRLAALLLGIKIEEV